MEPKKDRRDRGRETERKILDSALRLMRQKDFERVSVRDVCRDAGITTGAFYHHFSSKEDLLRLGFATLDDYMEEAMAPHLGEPPLERLRWVAEFYAAFIQEKVGVLARRYYQYRLSSGGDGRATGERYTYRVILDCLEEGREQGLLQPEYRPEEVAEYCLIHFRGIVIDWLLQDCGYDLREKFRRSFLLSRQTFQSEEGPPAPSFS